MTESLLQYTEETHIEEEDEEREQILNGLKMSHFDQVSVQSKEKHRRKKRAFCIFMAVVIVLITFFSWFFFPSPPDYELYCSKFRTWEINDQDYTKVNMDYISYIYLKNHNNASVKIHTLALSMSHEGKQIGDVAITNTKLQPNAVHLIPMEIHIRKVGVQEGYKLWQDSRDKIIDFHMAGTADVEYMGIRRLIDLDFIKTYFTDKAAPEECPPSNWHQYQISQNQLQPQEFLSLPPVEESY
mmetsp:Transcript_54438/g.62384  ORF Transcript_54438/g.62384 Transcript_54438/m.62384 type:complete len:242 (+) Transcript_54438:338-1063(+)|eukprot:CAMPEP_0114978328 /NCGR_PEP_ID=MMETSP0216-20121206/3744_1 /TAXON_ID=223996 /ORGANISM="Protocruzia adherens, Strain Boccale" /LENGTH=241 /DNA_ID=CAMNT_0002339509 /DNA_START=219 /DNA_END=944 /DNA_ORIENTATION=-